jgi:hypothetical protein
MIIQTKYFNYEDGEITMWDNPPAGKYWDATIVIDDSERMRVFHPKQLELLDSALLEATQGVVF